MRIAIIGTRGIPNNYGGFEQCAEYLAVGLVKKGFEVYVYNPHTHPYQKNDWNGVKIIHCLDPEKKIGSFGQFIYDYNCIVDSRKRNFDVILQLGYTSNSVWGWLLPRKAIITTNMDGLEWKRTKFSDLTKRFLLYAERLAVRYSDYLISDSKGVQDYLYEKYKRESTFIAYGADLVNSFNSDILQEYSLNNHQYDMLVARLEPENSIEIILNGVIENNSGMPFLVVGNHETAYGKFLQQKYLNYASIRFIGGIYDINKLNDLRHFSRLYFHGHTVGGTNPSLLEAMASNSLICAHDNPFNRYVLNEDALYFVNSSQIALHLQNVDYGSDAYNNMLEKNRDKIKNIYSWGNIIDQYASHFAYITEAKRK